MLKKIAKPLNPYDPAWAAYWEENPHLHRGVGADATEGEDDPTDPPKEEEKSDDSEGSDPNKSKGDKPTDAEAKLLKEVMDKKQKLKAATEELEGLKKQIKQFEGIDVEKVKSLLEQQKLAEQKKLEEQGEWDKLRAQMVEQHNQALEGVNSELEQLKAALSAKDSVINELTVGHAFDASDFIKEDLTLTPTKARIIYGNHFEVVDGKVVAFDKVGKDRTMLVDGQGNPLKFNDAIKKIVDADPDRDHIVKSKAKPGSDSKPKDKAKEQQPELRGQDKIAAGLAAAGK